MSDSMEYIRIPRSIFRRAIAAVVVLGVLAAILAGWGAIKLRNHLSALYIQNYQIDRRLTQLEAIIAGRTPPAPVTYTTDTNAAPDNQGLTQEEAEEDARASYTMPDIEAITRTPEEVMAYLDFDAADIALLSDLDMRPDVYMRSARQVEHIRDMPPSATSPSATSPSATPDAQSSSGPRLEDPVFIRAYMDTLETSDALTPPTLVLTDTATQYPRFEITDAPEGAAVFFEIDSSPEFTSLNLARIPSLSAYAPVANRTDRSAIKYQLFQARHGYIPQSDTPFALPFRSTALSLPMKDADFSTMVKFAHLVTHNLEHDDAIAEMFKVIAHRIDHGSATVARTPLQSFLSGVDECGHVNDLAGTLLEMNGLRYRGVGGFNPRLRTVMPNAGHSAIEVENAAGEWEYVDAYLGIHTPGVSAAQHAAEPQDSFVMWDTPKAVQGMSGLGARTHLGDIFAFRTYFDKAKRFPTQRVAALLDREDMYGRDFPPRELKEGEAFDPVQDLPESVTLYVRARYVVTELCQVRVRVGCGDFNALASRWTTETFTISPRELLVGKG